MKKLVISNSGKVISGKYYKNENDKHYCNYYVFRDLTTICDWFSNSDIDHVEILDDINLVIYYPDSIIYLNDADNIIDCFELRHLKRQLNRFLIIETKKIQNENKKIVKNKKAFRESKVGYAVVAGSLLVSLLSSTMFTSVSGIIDDKTINLIDDYIVAESVDKVQKDSDYVLINKNVQQTNGISIENDESKINEDSNNSLTAIKEDERIINMSFENRTMTQKAIDTRDNYGDIITKYAKMYGVDPNIMIAIATQERGSHSSVIDAGGGIGLMQLQYSVWVNAQMSAYNFDTGEIDTITITESNIGDLETNIKCACMLMQDNYKKMNYNIPAALQAYNWGYYQAKDVISNFARDNSLTYEEVLNDYSDTSFLRYFDKGYIYSNLVLSYVDTSNIFKNYKLDENNEVELVVYQIKNSYQNIKQF